MNKPTLTDDELLFAEQITQAARTVQPDAGFTRQLAQQIAHATHVPAHTPHSRVNLTHALASVAAALLIGVFAVFTIPSLRVWAQEIIDLITPVADTGFFLDNGSTSYESRIIYESHNQAEVALQRNLPQPTYLPTYVLSGLRKTYQLDHIFYYPEADSVETVYQFVHWNPFALRLITLPASTYTPYGIGESATVQQVQLNIGGIPVDAVYYQGMWITNTASSSTQLGTLNWYSDTPQVTLHWQFRDTIYILWGELGPYHDLTLSEMIRVAESIE